MRSPEERARDLTRERLYLTHKRASGVIREAMRDAYEDAAAAVDRVEASAARAGSLSNAGHDALDVAASHIRERAKGVCGE